MISPQGTVWLGHVPWDSSYRHVYYEGMVDKSAILGAFMTLRTDAYTYIREDTNIRVPYNADSIYGVNYCMYQNDGMWFCAFVNTITYVNNGTSLLHLEEDVWHTWGENIVWKTSYIAREHVSQDELGQWRAPEPAMELESVVLETQNFGNVFFNTIIVGTNAVPHLKSGGTDYFSAHTEDDFDGSDAVSGGSYGTIYSGTKYYGFGPGSYGALSNFLNNLNMCGAADSVACMFMMPSECVTISGYEVTGSAQPESVTLTGPQTLGGGYAPRNKKCLTYPYAYMSVTDNNGGELDFKYEDCATWGTLELQFLDPVDPCGSLYMRPRGYQAQSIDDSRVMPLGNHPQCSWIHSSYQTWAAQNAQTIQTKHTLNIGNAVIGGLMLAAGAALFATGFGAPAGGALGALGLTTGEAAGIGLAAGGLAKGAGTMANYAEMQAQIDAERKKPNQTVGASSSNGLQGIAMNSGGYRFVGLQLASARRLDWFFDVFGYQIDQLRLPNITSRPSWNYLKTIGASMDGNIPADRLAIINKCLDGGMTFWHTTDVGNYGLNNAL